MQRMTRILFPVCLLALLLGCDKLAQPQAPAMAVVDLNKVFTDSKAREEGMKLLETVKEKYEPKLKQMQEELAKKTQGAPGQADKDDSAAFGELFSQYQNAVNEEQTRLSAFLEESMGKAIDAVRAKRGVKVVLHRESVASFDAEADITDEVLKEFNAMPIAFPPAKAEPAPAPQPQAAPADPAKPAKP